MELGNLVTVLDLANYNSNYQEPVPFKAVLFEITDFPCYWVTSCITGNQYELYGSQILEIDGDPEVFGLKLGESL